MHSLGPGSTSPISGARPDACNYCHAPHSGLNRGLWNQTLSSETYTYYTSLTESNKGKQPTLGYSSSQCLSCHDGSVAVGNTVVSGQITMNGTMAAADKLGTNLQTSHPFSLVLPLVNNIDMADVLTSAHTTADPTHAVKLIGGNVECVSCHNPHVQAKDMVSQNFLVKDSSNGALCLACHDPTRTGTDVVNPLADWANGAHATSTNAISSSANLGSYSTVAKDACLSCHAPHNAAAGARNLRGQNEQDCIACHNGGTNLASMPAYANVFAEYGPIPGNSGSNKVGHPIPTSTNPHDASEAAVLNNNRHATCVDCHNSHGSAKVGVFPTPPLVRDSQKDIVGVSATDGTSVLAPAINQFENCLRCHGTSAGKQIDTIYGYFPNRQVSNGDPLNLIPQFAASSTSSHPVTHVSNSPLLQPSLLAAMLNLDGSASTRTMGTNGVNTQILCTDCHNSDDNREFGGAGANGPHGSKWTHILERNYQFNAPPIAPGGAVGNLQTSPDLSSTGSYALCAKCHNLNNTGTGGAVMSTDGTGSWVPHAAHINDGFSCATCHTSHGMGATNGAVSGERLVNFDTNIVGAVSGTPITYTRAAGANGTCVLVCHSVQHNADGTRTPVGAVIHKGIPIKK